VTWPEPVLADGAEEACRPPEVEVEAELPEPGLELELELPEPELVPELLVPELAWPVLVPLWVPAEEAAGAALAALARPAAMPPPARTLAAPIAAVTARSRRWPRRRAPPAAGPAGLPMSTSDRPSAGPSGPVPPGWPASFCAASAGPAGRL
jgi:hypothetical protein